MRRLKREERNRKGMVETVAHEWREGYLIYIWSLQGEVLVCVYYTELVIGIEFGVVGIYTAL